MNDTWNVTYMGHTLSDIQNDSIKIPLPYDEEEAERLRARGYKVWRDQIGGGTIIDRP